MIRRINSAVIIPIVVCTTFIFIMFLYVRKTEKEKSTYIVETMYRKYFAEEILEERNYCVIFVEHNSKNEIKVCGNYTIIEPKNASKVRRFEESVDHF
jgi:hypothetical protein